MKKHRILPALLTVCALFLGLLLPFLTAAGQDAVLQRSQWVLDETNAHYAYQGTLMNRVLALNAHLNCSPSVLRREAEAAPAPADLIASLSDFLPAAGAEAVGSAAFSLSPKQYSAEYRYLSIDYALEEGALAVTLDAETLLPLRMELSCAPELLNQWLKGTDLWDILRGYASLLDLGEPTDDETNISTVIRSQSSQLRGTAYKMTVTVVPSTGSLLLKLSASTPA